MKSIFASLLLLSSFFSFAASKNSDMNPTQLDDLIRGEMAAVKTYDQVLEKTKDEKERAKLMSIRDDHKNAVTKLKGFANKEVKEDTTSAGAWGAFTKAWTGSAKLFGNETALKALSQGEEHGIREYKEALEDDSIKPELKQMIKTQFLPKQEEHLKTIKTFM
jgi:uncharacterized protein (TIGR02284 family)